MNNLFGAQVGTNASYWVTDRFGLFIGAKVGVVGNQMNVRTRLIAGRVTAFDIPAHRSDFSMLAEIDTGITYFFRPGFITYLGYRVVAVTNVALGDNQFLPSLSDNAGFGHLIAPATDSPQPRGLYTVTRTSA